MALLSSHPILTRAFRKAIFVKIQVADQWQELHWIPSLYLTPPPNSCLSSSVSSDTYEYSSRKKKKRDYSFHQNILDYVPENISIINFYTSWTPLIKILPLIENNGHTDAQAQVGLGMLAGPPCLPSPTPSPHFPRAHSPPWQGRASIWVHSSWTHAVKDLSLVEFYLSGFWLSVLIVT